MAFLEKKFRVHFKKNERIQDIIQLFGFIPEPTFVYTGYITPLEEKYGYDTDGIKYSNLHPGKESPNLYPEEQDMFAEEQDMIVEEKPKYFSIFEQFNGLLRSKNKVFPE